MKFLFFVFAWMLPLLTLSRGVHALPEPGLLDRIAATATGGRPQRLAKYIYHGEAVFVVPARCCDIPGEVFDADGKKLCALGGGLANQVDASCADFAKSAKFVEEVLPPLKHRRKRTVSKSP